MIPRHRHHRRPLFFLQGFGLSYTTFSYSGLSAGSPTVDPCGTISLAVTVANTGKVDGDEVVQVYAKLPDASVPTTLVRLVAFERVAIKAGASATVQLVVKTTDLGVVYANGDVYTDSRSIEKGKVELYVGGGQPDYSTSPVLTAVTVTGTKALSSC